ncbi:MAG: nucleotidyltransferase domain-containing protein, partial [Nitrospirota bacterium]|nr:nucleotidyltransferase domain-containing protein [Nitrospirota bacterium]
KKHYGHRLVSIVVFGSVARETYRADSDIDILLIANRLPKGRTKRVAEFMKKHICPCIEYDFCNVWVKITRWKRRY